MIKASELEINRAIAHLEKQIGSKPFKKMCVEVKDGIKQALRVLKEKDDNLQHIADLTVFSRSRMIAWIAVDFLHGECDRKILLSVFDVERKKLNK